MAVACAVSVGDWTSFGDWTSVGGRGAAATLRCSPLHPATSNLQAVGDWKSPLQFPGPRSLPAVPGPWSPVPATQLAAADVELVCARGVIVTMLPRTAVVGASRMMPVTVTGLEDAPPPPHEEAGRSRNRMRNRSSREVRQR